MLRLFMIGPRGAEAEPDAEQRRLLEDAGYSVLEPRDVVERARGRAAKMRACVLRALRCGGVVLLPGWDASRDARLIELVAGSCGVGCHAPGWWLREARVLARGR